MTGKYKRLTGRSLWLTQISRWRRGLDRSKREIRYSLGSGGGKDLFLGEVICEKMSEKDFAENAKK